MDVPQFMTAATVIEYNEPLKILHDVPVPAVPENGILIRIEASSLCSSDLMGHGGHMKFMTALPYCAGHEPVGTVVKLGLAVKGFAIGDRVGYLMFSNFCETCDECFRGEHRFCPKRSIEGFSTAHGGFSQYSLAHPKSTLKLPDNLSFVDAAPFFCAGVTAYGALIKNKSKPGGLVNIIGCGGVGHMAVMLAKAMGFQVHAYDVADDKLALAKRSGADLALDSRGITEDSEKALTTVVISGAAAAYSSAFTITSTHGAVVAVGLPAGNLEINLALWGSKNLTLYPCNTGTREDMADCLKLASRHNLKPEIEVRKITEINEGFADLAAGKVNGRIVYQFT